MTPTNGDRSGVGPEPHGTDDRNEVLLEGRVSAAPERRTLPSGDEVVALRLVVRRAQGGVDTLPVSLGPAPPPGARRARGQVGRRVLANAEALPAGARVRVGGRLRRRWWRAGGDLRSRIEVEASVIETVGDASSVSAR